MSTCLRKDNGPSRHLLRTVGNRPVDDRRQTPMPKRPSPGIHDDPVSSEDELSHEPELPPHSNRQPDAGPLRRTGRFSNSKRSFEESQATTGAHLQDDFGFVGSSQSQKRAKVRKGYAGAVHAGTQSTRKRLDGKKATSAKGSKGTKDFKNPLADYSVDETLHPLEEDSPAGSFQDPGAKYSLPSSSLDNELGAAFKVPANLPEDINVHAPVGTKPRRSEKTRPNSSNDIATGEVFRNPKLLLDIGNEQLQDLLHKGHPLLSATSSSGITSALDVLASSEESALSSPPESPVVGSKEPSSPALSRVESSNTLLCPMCKVCVDRNFFETFEGGGRKNVRSQARFCRAHKVKSAREEWSRRGYPEITWTFLPARIKKHHSHLRKVLSGKIPSSYRESLEATIKTGKNRTLRQSMLTGNIRGLTPGYYGSRGARVMMEGIMSKFSSEIRKLAATDKTISSGGVSNYVQAVLVPELAVLLVKEDMGCDDDAAKNVLKDSIDIGDLLNEEQDDEIRYDVLAAESE